MEKDRQLEWSRINAPISGVSVGLAPYMGERGSLHTQGIWEVDCRGYTPGVCIQALFFLSFIVPFHCEKFWDLSHNKYQYNRKHFPILRNSISHVHILQNSWIPQAFGQYFGIQRGGAFGQANVLSGWQQVRSAWGFKGKQEKLTAPHVPLVGSSSSGALYQLCPFRSAILIVFPWVFNHLESNSQ